MKALAWDDEANATDESLRYMQRLKDELSKTGIAVDLVDDSGDFIKRLNEGGYDFYITDWVNDQVGKAKDGKKFGSLMLNAVRRVNKEKPIFVVSRHTKKIDESLLNFAKPIFLKSKDVTAAWLAYDISETLRDMGLLVDPTRVFILDGSSVKSQQEAATLKSWLVEEYKIQVQLLSGRQSREGISPALRQDLQTCAAFIAICTTDVEFGPSREKQQQPATNVVFELGLVHGLPQGGRKLIVLRQDGSLIQDKAVLDLRWGGHQELTFEKSVTEVKEDLKRRLKTLGVKMD